MNYPTVHVYIQSTCFYCHEQINWMKQQEYDFITKDVAIEENKNIVLDLGGQATPFTVITYENGETKTISGYQKEDLKKIMGTLK